MAFHNREDRDIACSIGCLAIIIIALMAFLALLITTDSHHEVWGSVSCDYGVDRSQAGTHTVIVREW